jgi:hypothetical protein
MLCLPTVNASMQSSLPHPLERLTPMGPARDARSSSKVLLAAMALVATLAGCTTTTTTTTTSPSLVVMADGGEFVETERTAQHSTVEVRKAPQGSVPSSMYALRGSCAVMRARGENHVASTSVSNSPPTFRLTFPSAPDAAQRSGPGRSVISRTECALLGF